MFIVAIISAKGGTHKSGTTIGLGVAATMAGFRTVIIDLDAQATVARWRDRRAQDKPTVTSAQSSRVKPVLDACSKEGVEFVVMDTDGQNGTCAMDAARVADLVIIPCRTNIVEIETLQLTKDMLALAGQPKAFVLLNGIHPTASRQADEARDLIKTLFNMRCCPGHLCTRQAYAKAPEEGLSPQEYEPDGKAAAELQQLFKFVARQGKLREKRNGTEKRVRETT